MRRIAAWVCLASACQVSIAGEVPAVGVWEQLPVADPHGGANVSRHDIIFVNRKINEDTVFSGLVDAGTKTGVLCCLRVSKNALITLPELLKKYQWDDDEVDHMKKITGWKYIYEANVANRAEQNPSMRTLVKNLSLPPALSPYSAAVISGKIASDEVDRKFMTGGAAVTFTTRSVPAKNAIQYKFSVNGEPVTLMEDAFPD
ncbi:MULTISPECIES: hypothetical protein [Burkholderia cepacia complex]|uniref:hypothetical protein n=1 Tax=Burkholderia cepacia complex TaxID=87882 RepID=UPI000B230489|nr:MULTISPECIES: hypothetical protein [Burkholderia cepacia complex]MBH9643735.1 hypothetical protein [Burkholderia vietnamiensis]MBR7998441.1 hypothetical protein [Burkholderia vietnamiensis]MCA8267619.1 hypothetical protein [Burkholderia vietnamiensis]UKV74097.1 hypothetical protein FOC29_12200 [Burkholderia vietnamiensis]CAG9212287.1 conserved exported hypothetical protein [Burkholderia vietnamiensis]